MPELPKKPPINVHDLINIKGAGNAEKELKKAGNWDEYAGLEYKKYNVSFLVLVNEERTVTVKARCKEEAEELAYTKVDTENDVYETEDEPYRTEELK